MFGFNPDKMSNRTFNDIAEKIILNEIKIDEKKGLLVFQDSNRPIMTVVVTDNLKDLALAPVDSPDDETIAKKTYQQFVIKQVETGFELPSLSQVSLAPKDEEKTADTPSTSAVAAQKPLTPPPARPTPTAASGFSNVTAPLPPASSNDVATHSATTIRAKIEQWLSGIDEEIDRMTIPEQYNAYQPLADEFKKPFACYREQFYSHRQFCSPGQLKADLKKLQQMQRSMYMAARSPDAKANDMPLVGIVNRGYDCLPISVNQYEIHNQYFTFFVTAYQLLGEDALDLPSATEVNATHENSKEYKEACAACKKITTNIDTLKNDNRKKADIIDLYTKKNMPKANIEQKKLEITMNEVTIKELTETLNTATTHKNQKQAEQVKSQLKTQQEQRAQLISQANKWSTFYNQLMNPNPLLPITLPEPFKNKIDRGNTFPADLFNVPRTLKPSYFWHTSEYLISKPWRSVVVNTGEHFFTYVKHKDGTITELNDKSVHKAKYKNAEELMMHYLSTPHRPGIYIDHNQL